jgi:polyferredoxin
MLDSRNNNSKITQWIATIAMSTLLAIVCLSDIYNTQSNIGLCVALWLLCIIGLFFETKTMQHLRPVMLFGSLVWFGFAAGGCNCILFYVQGFILFLAGNTAFWLSFATIITILILSVIFGPLWCGWLCWLGALQEFIYKQNRWKWLKSQKTKKIFLLIQICAFVALAVWVLVTQRPVLCAYDPFISIFKLKIFNWIGYITVPLLLISSLFIYRPFCRIFCPIGLLLYMIKRLPFAKQLKLKECTHCRKCYTHCKLNAIHHNHVEKTCNMCGECKQTDCKSIIT